MLLAPMIALLGETHTNWPKWVDHTLAGYALANDQHHNSLGVRDPQTGYMVIRDPECDGSNVNLYLTKDRYEVTSFGYSIPDFALANKQRGLPKITLKPLPNLKTGKGLQIGDSPQRMLRLLGKPTKIEKIGKQNQFTEYEYEAVNKKATPARYNQNYTFKEGKLIEIYFGYSGE